MRAVRILVVGAGAIGRAHAERLAKGPGDARLAGVVDPAPAARDWAQELGAPIHADLGNALAADRPDAAIVATPNDTHLPLSLALLKQKIPVLVEKPIASTVVEAEALTTAARAEGVPVLVGHHRRHNPIIRAARQIIDEGRLGRLVSVTAMATFLKPEPYFEFEWRRHKPGGGPIVINLIHDIDLVRHLCGEIVSVQALVSSATRGFVVEDTAAALMRLDNGALVTLALSDTAAAPWNWDLSAGESAHYPPQPMRANSHFICGAEGALTLPYLEYWRYDGPKGWHCPLSASLMAHDGDNPYDAQIAHFCRVARGEEAPLVSAEDATRTLRATLAVREAAETGRLINLVG